MVVCHLGEIGYLVVAVRHDIVRDIVEEVHGLSQVTEAGSI